MFKAFDFCIPDRREDTSWRSTARTYAACRSRCAKPTSRGSWLVDWTAFSSHHLSKARSDPSCSKPRAEWGSKACVEAARSIRSVAGLGQGEKPEPFGDRPRERSLRARIDVQYLNRIGRRVITTMIVDAGEHLEFAQPLSATASLPRDIEVEARADAALIKEADGRAIPILETISHDGSHNAGSDLLCGVTTMLRKTVIALLAVVLIGLSPTGASARGFGGFGGHGFGGGGWHGGGWGHRGFGGWGLGAGALAGAVIGGAIASSAYGYDGPYYDPGYSYYPAYVGYSPYYDYGPWQAIQEPGAARFHRPWGYW